MTHIVCAGIMKACQQGESFQLSYNLVSLFPDTKVCVMSSATGSHQLFLWAIVCIIMGTSGASLTNNTHRAVLGVFYFLINCLYFYHPCPWSSSLFWDTKTGKFQLGALRSPIHACSYRTLGKELMTLLQFQRALCM